jgi:hypothetical protein
MKLSGRQGGDGRQWWEAPGWGVQTERPPKVHLGRGGTLQLFERCQKGNAETFLNLHTKDLPPAIRRRRQQAQDVGGEDGVLLEMGVLVQIWVSPGYHAEIFVQV